MHLFLLLCLHADPTRCRVFHKCSASGEKKTFICRVGNAFDSRQRRCLPSPHGSCFTSGEGGKDTRDEKTIRMNTGRRRGMRRYEQRIDSVKTDSSSADLNVRESSAATKRDYHAYLPLGSERAQSRKSSTRVQHAHAPSGLNVNPQNKPRESIRPEDKDAGTAQSLYFSSKTPQNTHIFSDAHITGQGLSREGPINHITRWPERALPVHSSRDVPQNAHTTNLPRIPSQNLQRDLIINTRDSVSRIASPTHSSDSYHENTPNSNVLQITAHNVTKEGVIKPRDQNTLTSKYYSKENESPTPLIQIGIESSFLSPLQSSLIITEEQADSESSRQMPMRRFVIDGILPQYQNSPNNGVSKFEMTVGERSTQLAREPESDTQTKGLSRTLKTQESDKEVGTCDCLNDLLHLLKNMDGNRDSNQTGAFLNNQENINGGFNLFGMFEDGQGNNEKDFSNPEAFGQDKITSKGDAIQPEGFESNQQGGTGGTKQPVLNNGEKHDNNDGFYQAGILKSSQDGGFNRFGIFLGNQQHNNEDSNQYGIFNREQQNKNNKFNQPGAFESIVENSNGGFNQFGIIVGNQENSREDTNQSGISDGDRHNENKDFNQRGTFEINQENNNRDLKQFGIFVGNQRMSIENSNQPGISLGEQQNSDNEFKQLVTFESNHDKENNNEGSNKFDIFYSERENNDQESNQTGKLENTQENSNSDSNQTFQHEEKNIIFDSLYPNLESILGKNVNGNMNIDITSLFNSLQENNTTQDGATSTTEDTGIGEAFIADNANLSPKAESGISISSDPQSKGMNRSTASGDDFNAKQLKTNQNNTFVKVNGGYNYGPVMKEYKEQVTVTTSYILSDQATENPSGITFLNQFQVSQTEKPLGANPNTIHAQLPNGGSITNIVDGNKATNDNSPHEYYKFGNGEDNPLNYNQYYQKNVDNSFNNQFSNTQRQQMPNFDYTYVPKNEQTVVLGHFITEIPPAGTFSITQLPRHRGMKAEHSSLSPIVPTYQHPISYLPQKPMFENRHISLPKHPNHSAFYVIDPRIQSSTDAVNSHLPTSMISSGNSMNNRQTNILSGLADHETSIQDSVGSNGADSESSGNYAKANKALLTNNSSNNDTQQDKENGADVVQRNPTKLIQTNVPATMAPLPFTNQNFAINPIQFLPPTSGLNGGKFANLQTTQSNPVVQSDRLFQTGDDRNNYYMTSTAFKAAVTPQTFISPPFPIFNNPYRGPPLYTTILPYITQTTLTPMELFNLQSPPQVTTGIVNQVEIVRSISFSLDSEDGRRQLEMAQSQGIWK